MMSLNTSPSTVKSGKWTTRAIGLVLAGALLAAPLVPGAGPAAALAGDDSLFSKEIIGGVLGAVGGGVVGSQFGKGSGKTAATIIGAIAGAGLGGYLGNAMDQNDQNKAGHALETARDNQPVAWKNPNTGNNYKVVPTKTYQADGAYCREYTTTGWIDGQEQTLTGTACRQPDGTWKQNG